MATILLVEDDDDAAEVVAHALRKSGHRVMSVPNGRDALALLLLGTIDLVVTDLRMPEMDGVTLLTVMRSYLRFKSTPVIVFSAYAEGRTGQSVRDLGVAEVFRKGSANLDEIVAAVGRHLNPPAPNTSRN